MKTFTHWQKLTEEEDDSNEEDQNQIHAKWKELDRNENSLNQQDTYLLSILQVVRSLSWEDRDDLDDIRNALNQASRLVQSQINQEE